MRLDVLDVSFALSRNEAIAVGRLALEGNIGVFEYDRSFAASGLSLNPLFAGAAPGLVRARAPQVFGGLHGVFADSLPDAWGQVLLERRLRRAGGAPSELTALERLAYVGRRGRGALAYEPHAGAVGADGAVHLETLAREADDVLLGKASEVVFELDRVAASSGGARPKAHVALNAAGDARSDDSDLPPGFSAWIVKFRARTDVADSGPLEAAYAEIARRAGIEMPQTRLIEAKSGPGFFASERFDRVSPDRRVHALSLAGMLDADWTVPSLDYERLLDAVRAATRDEQAVTEMFGRMAFNVLAVNRDDHLKQHALLQDRSGRWRLSPAYDLTFSRGPGDEHYLAVNGRGRDISRADLLAVADGQSIAPRRAAEIIERVAEALRELPAVARDFGVSRATLRDVLAAQRMR